MDQRENKTSFSWLSVIRDAGLTGFSAMLATHCEPKSFDPITMSMEIEVHASMKKYVDVGMGGELQKKLREVMGEGLIIEWRAGPASNSPAVKARSKRTGRVIETLKTIESDVFFEIVSKTMGGRIILESIKYEGVNPV